MKKRIKQAVPQPIWDYARYWQYRLLKRGHFALNRMDHKLKSYLDFRDGFFVELGANDGFSQSNTLYFERRMGWRGVLIEPSPHLFLNCAHLRGRPGNHLFCNACVPFDYDEPYVEIEYANLMSVSRSLSLDIEDVDAFVARARDNLKREELGLRFGALARTLTSILDDSTAPPVIDLLSLDVEGAELDVLRGVDFARYRFRFMLIECRDIDRLSQYLGQHGYARIDQLSKHDYLFAPGTAEAEAGRAHP